MATERQIAELVERLLVLAVDKMQGRIEHGEWQARRAEVWRDAYALRVAHIVKARIMREAVEEA